MSEIKGDVARAVARLKQQPGQDILMYGCGELARTLMLYDLAAYTSPARARSTSPPTATPAP